MADRLQHGRDTAAQWARYNPVLLEGEQGYITDQPGLWKIGDGVHHWNDLPLYGGKDNFVECTEEQIASMISGGTWVAGTIYYTVES